MVIRMAPIPSLAVERRVSDGRGKEELKLGRGT